MARSQRQRIPIDAVPVAELSDLAGEVRKLTCPVERTLETDD
jgi:hypothetical protein